ncbi:MAG TPA: 2-succinyl-5-enolpyruvyl-6-hydroxy-3-cyclohexene-1-carboxylic-acid synthase [Chloroflexota bacterium]|nr:2-succinyl-5-enolpyruvyl-6-hydroxy-3-cyclohexene-1-carboxylic-acid synthase [Chloroflexota bacterium]
MGSEALSTDLGAFVSELARAGLRHVCVCPGSRSTPLAVLFDRHPAIHVWMHLDERSAGFFALGMAKVRREPVAVLTTSGTAAANLHPAVAEASYGRVPLLVLTADRPHELREVGAAQTMNQVGLFGDMIRLFHDLPIPDGHAAHHFRSVADRALAAAGDAPAGPVHLNFPFREPLIPADADLSLGPAQTHFHAGRKTLAADDVTALARQLEGQRGIMVAGPRDDPRLPPPAHRLAAAFGFPLLADPLSGARDGAAISTYDAFLRVWQPDEPPSVVLRTGGLPTSKPLAQYLQSLDARHIAVDEAGWPDPLGIVTDIIHADPASLFDALAACVPAPTQGWHDQWAVTDRATRDALHVAMDDMDEPFEGRVFAELAELVPSGSILWAGSSMPVRDLDSFFPGRSDVRCLANRGVNGIDGVVSSALGAAATAPLVLVLGDLSFYHDMNGLLAASRHGIDATIVVINNDGGGIFSFLPQADLPDFEPLFGTPHGLDFRHAAELYNATFERIDGWESFRSAVAQGVASPGLSIVEVPTDRQRNVALHRRVWDVVASTLEGVTV